MLKAIRLWVLQHRVARLFDTAESLAIAGRVKGDQVFIDLHNKAKALIQIYVLQYPQDADLVKREMPGLQDLYDLTIPAVTKQPLNMAIIVLGSLLGTIVGGFVLGGLGGFIELGYRLVTTHL